MTLIAHPPGHISTPALVAISGPGADCPSNRSRALDCRFIPGRVCIHTGDQSALTHSRLELWYPVIELFEQCQLSNPSWIQPREELMQLSEGSAPIVSCYSPVEG